MQEKNLPRYEKQCHGLPKHVKTTNHDTIKYIATYLEFPWAISLKHTHLRLK